MKKQKAEVGIKFTDGKPRTDLLPFRAVLEVSKVLSFAVPKYGANNWRKVRGWRWKYIGAALRHLSYYMLGDRTDPESGLPHLAHALCSIMFVLEQDLNLNPYGDVVEEAQPALKKHKRQS